MKVAMFALLVGLQSCVAWAQSGFEQVHITPMGVPAPSPTGSRFSVIVNRQTSNKGLINASQFIYHVCGEWDFQIGYQSQPAFGGANMAFGYVVHQGSPVYPIGPGLTAAEHEFSIVADGTTWIFAVDGQPFFTVGTTCGVLPSPAQPPIYITNAYEQYMQQSGRLIKLQDLVFTRAFSFLQDGVWIDAGPGTGLAGGDWCQPSGCSVGAHGVLQDADLQVNQARYSTRYRGFSGPIW